MKAQKTETCQQGIELLLSRYANVLKGPSPAFAFQWVTDNHRLPRQHHPPGPNGDPLRTFL